MVLEKAIQDNDLRQRLVTIFNDKNKDYAQSLKKEINDLPGIDTLRYAPKAYSVEVGEEITKVFGEKHLIPTLFFVDPWGYKGLSLQLVGSVLRDWGCDCIFFFNYTRINMGLDNPAVREHMDALFGKERTDHLREKLNPLTPYERELTIVEEICQALTEETAGKYVLPFCFWGPAYGPVVGYRHL